MRMRIQRPRTVPVRAYVRYRFGRWEHVCRHWRSCPRWWAS